MSLEHLRSLINGVLQHPVNSDAWGVESAKVMDKILRPRYFVRPCSTVPKTGIYREIDEQMQTWFWQSVAPLFDRDDPNRNCIETFSDKEIEKWLENLRDKACQTVLTHDYMDLVAQAVQKTQAKTDERRYAMQGLYQAIQLSGKIIPPSRQRWSGLSDIAYEEMLSEARLKTLEIVKKKIDEYKPEKHFMYWFNSTLGFRFLDCYEKFCHQNENEMPIPPAGLPILAPEPLEEPPLSPSGRLRKLLETDLGDKYKNEKMLHSPHVNFQLVALERLVVRKRWREIGEKFEVDPFAVRKFFNNRFKKFEQDFRNLFN